MCLFTPNCLLPYLPMFGTPVIGVLSCSCSRYSKRGRVFALFPSNSRRIRNQARLLPLRSALGFDSPVRNDAEIFHKPSLRGPRGHGVLPLRGLKGRGNPGNFTEQAECTERPAICLILQRATPSALHRNTESGSRLCKPQQD